MKKPDPDQITSNKSGVRNPRVESLNRLDSHTKTKSCGTKFSLLSSADQSSKLTVEPIR